MKPLVVVLALLLLSTGLASAGKQTVDIVKFTPPAAYKKTAWVKELKKGSNQTYTMIDKDAGTYCRIAIYYSTESKGDLDAEFLREWSLLKQHGVTGPGQVTDPREENGWKIKAGVATFEFDGKPAFAMLTTFTGHGRTTSIVVLTSSEAFFPVIEKFIGSVELKKPAGATAKTPAPSPPPAKGGKVEHAEQYMEYNTMLKTWVWKWRYPKSR